jgi:hypothetical protein
MAGHCLIDEHALQAELLELVAKDEKGRENKKAKKKGKKKCKGEGKGEQVLCGCGAVCDTVSCQRSRQRSFSGSPDRSLSPVHAAPSSPKSVKQGSDADTSEEKSRAEPTTLQQSTLKHSPRPSSSSTLGRSLMSPNRASDTKSAAPVPLSPDGGWETILAGGKGRRSISGAGPRKPLAAEPGSQACRGASPEPQSRRHAPVSIARSTQLGHAPVSTTASRQPALRAVPVTAATHHAPAAKAGPATRARPDDRSQAASAAASGATSVQQQPYAAPVKPAPLRVLTSEDPVLIHPKQQLAVWQMTEYASQLSSNARISISDHFCLPSQSCSWKPV